jgi:hypothetical protein
LLACGEKKGSIAIAAAQRLIGIQKGVLPISLGRGSRSFCGIPALFAGAITVDDAALCQIIRREFDLDAVARENSYPVPAQTSGNVRQNNMAVIELDGKSCAGKNLLDAAEDFERRFFHRIGRFNFRYACTGFIFSITSRNGSRSFYTSPRILSQILPERKQSPEIHASSEE